MSLIIITGDFNCDLLKKDHVNPNIKKMKDVIDIYQPSRTTNYSQTLIDLIDKFYLVSGVRTIVKGNDSSAEGLAINWINRGIYWTDTGSDTIEMSYLNGSLRRVIIKY